MQINAGRQGAVHDSSAGETAPRRAVEYAFLPKAKAFWPVLAFCLTGAASSALADWEQELTDQIAEELNCEVSFLSQVTEREVEGHRVVMAKVHCVDKRAFDAYRGDEYDLFEFRLCGEEDVSAC